MRGVEKRPLETHLNHLRGDVGLLPLRRGRLQLRLELGLELRLDLLLQRLLLGRRGRRLARRGGHGRLFLGNRLVGGFRWRGGGHGVGHGGRGHGEAVVV